MDTNLQTEVNDYVQLLYSRSYQDDIYNDLLSKISVLGREVNHKLRNPFVRKIADWNFNASDNNHIRMRISKMLYEINSIDRNNFNYAELVNFNCNQSLTQIKGITNSSKRFFDVHCANIYSALNNGGAVFTQSNDVVRAFSIIKKTNKEFTVNVKLNLQKDVTLLKDFSNSLDFLCNEEEFISNLKHYTHESANYILPGYYLENENIIRVRYDKRGKIQIHELIGRGEKKKYQPMHHSYMLKLIGLNRMSDGLVEEISRNIAYCIICGRPLTLEKSIKEGIGPICKKKISEGYAAFSGGEVQKENTGTNTSMLFEVGNVGTLSIDGITNSEGKI